MYLDDLFSEIDKINDLDKLVEMEAFLDDSYWTRKFWQYRG